MRPFPLPTARQLVSDSGSQAAVDFVAYAGQKVAGVPHPAVFVLDREGRIRWSKIETDYRERPSNAEIRAAVDAVP